MVSTLDSGASGSGSNPGRGLLTLTVLFVTQVYKLNQLI